MNEELKIEYIDINKLKPYERNARKHQQADVDTIKNSILEFGMCDPIGVWNDTIVEGHGRLIALKQLGYKKVPCIRLDFLSDEQRRAYGLAHNKTAEMSEWDFDFLETELNDICDIDMTDFGFDLIDETEKFKRNMQNADDMEEDDEYNEFVDKFKTKKTTDDCYTPQNVYDAIKDWAVEKYSLQGRKIIRPFYPGGDYAKENYPKGCVVIDNPPFSILTEIKKFYLENEIDFFLFAPTLTLFGSNTTEKYVIINCGIVYENGALVKTSFVTNLGTEKILVSSELHKIVKEQNDINTKAAVELPKYRYPKEVISAAIVQKWASYGIDVSFNKCHFIRQLDSQKADNKELFGGGFLVSEKEAAKAAEAAEAAKAAKAAEAAKIVWELSEREKEIIKSLGE